MSEHVILQDIEVSYEDRVIYKRLRVKPGSSSERRLEALLPVAQSLARPKVAFKIVRPEAAGEGKVSLDGVIFKSGLLAKHVTESPWAFPYVGTCGRELDEWAKGLSGLENFMANEIMIVTLHQAVRKMEEMLRSRFEFNEVSAMNPGSLPNEWPLVEQRPLFELMGEFPGQVGVNLLPSLLMDPGKSVSGVYFQTTEKFHSCQLCTKEDCPNRRAPFQGDDFHA
ncbi:MAG: hypothetical protein LBV79_08290 [Candidatus Adiutrix sp.]|jgi:hypothetical protein|nr:hypothetical protein [Candidatus Adiutrix sp.]